MSIQVPYSLTHSKIETIVISANGAGVALPADWKGWRLTQVHLLASVDAALTFTINQHNGGQWGTVTTTAATGGVYMSNNAATAECRYITGTPTYTLSDMSGGTLTVEAVLVR